LASATLQKDASLGGPYFLTAIAKLGILINAALYLVSPEQYRESWKTLIKTTAERTDLQHYFVDWPIIFNAMSIMSNQHCPSHINPKAGKRCLDSLVTFGKYTNGSIHFPKLCL
jgi:hypothetical protein